MNVKIMSKNTGVLLLLIPVVFLLNMPLLQAAAETKGKQAVHEQKNEGEVAAELLVKKALELIALNEYDRGVKMLENVIDQYPESRIRYKAFLALGRHFIDVQNYMEAIKKLRGLNSLFKPDKNLSGEDKEWYLEAQYLTGVAYFHMRQYDKAFNVLRSITRDYPNSVWANQSHYYIGMCHFAQKNWNKAIEGLSLVGTFVDPDSPSTEYVEGGRRFYIKVVDDDIPIMSKTGKEISIELTTKNHDREIISLVPLSGDANVAIGSIATIPKNPVPHNNVLEVIGGDIITAKYIDETTAEGKSMVQKQTPVKVVSSASAGFMLGNYEAEAEATFLGQPLFVMVNDLDMDVSPEADKLNVRLFSRYTREGGGDQAAGGADIEPLSTEEKEYIIRDEVTVTLTEEGTNAPVHTGRFLGKINLIPAAENVQSDKSDALLSGRLGDEIVLKYTDQLHVEGTSPRDVTAVIKVAGELDGRPIATQSVVTDPIVKTEKQIIEAKAYLELTRIFKSMGLTKNAKDKAKEGLERVQNIIGARLPIPSRYIEEAFTIKWELLIETDDYEGALSTCAVFNRLFPNSPYADEALLKVGYAYAKNKNYNDALTVFRRIVSFPHSRVKAEAQYLIGETLLTQADSHPASSEIQKAQYKSKAMQEFKLCAEHYPDSEFAGKCLGKLVDYFFEIKDYAQAEDLLQQIFKDYPDEKFLDSMLLKWVILAYQTGDYEKALEKCNQLLFEYPNSPLASEAKIALGKIETKLKK
jgi:TolA-binding protein